MPSSNLGRGSSSGVERKLPKLDVAGSIPVSRSTFPPLSLPIYLLLCLAFSLAACGPKHLVPESPLDTAANHYQRGLAQLEAGAAMDAEREFERARLLDPDFPGSQVGMALVAAEGQDFWRARQELAKALHKDGRFADAYIALGRIVTAEGVQRGYPVDTWSKEALAAYKKAGEHDPDNPAVPYYRGRCFLEAMQLEPARVSFAEALGKARGPWVKRTQDALGQVQLIERVAPGSSWGLKIALLPRITRGELSVLLIEELKLDELGRQRRLAPDPPQFRDPSQPAADSLAQATDISTSWARPWIEQVLKLGVAGLETTPDHLFQPGMAINRANMALVTQGILVLLTGDQELATRYLGEASRFPDVRSDSYAYSAIALNAERGIITADQLSGLFHPEDPVSGGEALQIIRNLQNAVRLDF